ncbi:carnitine O-acetyltransferase [Dipodascopsis tothii]|uniref:carnitine O-acetyltransferase n=1 Tax=Dipodascopsis tothii TaxID=44089 RepID=UPI0034CFA670
MFSSKLRALNMTRASKSSVRAMSAASSTATAPAGTPPMLKYQASLPALPVPTLEQTLPRYIQSLRPLLSADEMARSESAVREFLAGDAQKLQDRLLQRAGQPGMKNWLAEWWNEAAYMAYRDPVVPYVSYFYAHEDDRSAATGPKRAAKIVSAALQFKAEVDAGTLEPEYLGKNKLAMCMDSYKWMFNACRVPAAGKDHSDKFPEAENAYLVVIRKNKFFKVPHEVDGQRLSTAQLEQVFDKVVAAAGTAKGPPVGALTAENRDTWAAVYTELEPANRDTIRAIQASSFVVCLDDSTPSTLEERAHNFWHGDGQNRWYDKPCQFIICDNGVSGFMGEHSMMDGTPTCRLNDYVCTVLAKNTLAKTPDAPGGVPEPVALDFSLSEKVSQALPAAQAYFASEIGKHELAVLRYTRYGKNQIKKFRCSPDSFAQMVIQLGYYKLFGQCRPTYESASTRQFQLGRTETCRTVSSVVVAYVKAFEDPQASTKAKIEAFRKALAGHGEYIGAATNALGVDRHMFGLKKLIQPGEPVPAIFTDPAFAYSSSWYLSTSQLSSEYFNGYGWSQVIDDGFGVAYMVNGDWLNFNVVSKKQGSARLAECMRQAADDLADVLSTELEIKAKL